MRQKDRMMGLSRTANEFKGGKRDEPKRQMKTHFSEAEMQ